jgi:hypothetical protein
VSTTPVIVIATLIELSAFIAPGIACPREECPLSRAHAETVVPAAGKASSCTKCPTKRASNAHVIGKTIAL